MYKALFLIISFLSTQAVSASIFDLNLWKADSKLTKEQYTDAMNEYLKIQAKDPSNQRLNYNLGTALYRLGAYDNAAFNFHEAAQKAPTPLLQEKAYYNLGNALFKKEDYETAIKAYESALSLVADDEDAKHNLELARKKLEEEQQQQQDQKQDQQKQDQDENKDDQDQDKQDQQQKQDQDQNKDDQEDKKDKSKQNQAKPQEQKKDKKEERAKQELKMLLQQVKEGTPKGDALGVKSKKNTDPKAKLKPW